MPLVIDPDQNPAEVKRLGVQLIGSVVFEIPPENEELTGQPVRQIVKPYEIYRERIIDGSPGPTEFSAENAFSTAIVKLLENDKKRIYFLEGHNEPGIEDKEKLGLETLARTLKNNNYTVQPLNLATRREIPKNADLIAVAAPQSSLFKSEVELLVQYAKAGGNLLLLVEFATDPGMQGLFNHLGIEVGDNLVIDPARSDPRSSVTLIPLYGKHPIVDDIKAARQNLLFHTARSTERALGDTRGISTTSLLSTTRRDGQRQITNQTRRKRNKLNTTKTPKI